MEHYAAIDGALEWSSVCVADAADGRVAPKRKIEQTELDAVAQGSKRASRSAESLSKT
jgi:hypothetical protein